MKREWLGLAIVAMGSLVVTCGKTRANRVIIVDSKRGYFTVTGAAPVSFGFTAGVFQPDLCKEKNVFVFRGDACACGFAGKAGHAYQVQKDGKLKDLGVIDLQKPDAEIPALFGIEKTEPLQKHSFPYPLL